MPVKFSKGTSNHAAALCMSTSTMHLVGLFVLNEHSFSQIHLVTDTFCQNLYPFCQFKTMKDSSEITEAFIDSIL